MTVKSILIVIFFLASIVLTIYGGWNYMQGRINQYEETAKAEKLATQGYNAEEALQKIRKEKNISLILFAAGVAGLFLIVTNASRRRNSLNTSTKQNLKANSS
jgi:TRAP-type C4-dicarboxylate transport system permease small subunit